MADRWRWYGFESQVEGRPVQDWWFNELDDNDRFEILDLLNFLSNARIRQWRKPEFDPLIGAGGISEIRVHLRDDKGAIAYRIYGYFGPNKGNYCFLHGKSKDVKNDRDGKRVAKYRLEEIRKNEARPYEFIFKKGTVVEINKRQ